MCFLASYKLKSWQDLSKPEFKISERGRPEACADRGCMFKSGFVRCEEKKWVNVVLYIQNQSGYWERKEFKRQGPGYMNLSLSDCKYTGNYYAYACYQDDKQCAIPENHEVEAMHNKKDQTPKFKILKITRGKCSTGQGENVKFESGYVYSPTGGQVEITLFMEKSDGKWSKKHYTFNGTGNLNLAVDGCDLTGNYKTMIQYVK
ncbi:MAG: hypothetical protein EAZ57_07485 [Cytophagales bacterium]|nr:MAG: hypothetical protein EAZ67_08570 [Cytophagales bacterium]TAF60380.1 MAG: hypothetical protein EAZ57_07485 [Cytophagales bacterium]